MDLLGVFNGGEVNCTGERRTGAFRVASLGGIQPERALGATR